MAKGTILSEWKGILGSLMVLAFLLFVSLWPLFCLLLAATFGVGWLSRGWRDRPSSNTDGDLPELMSHLEGIFRDFENIYLEETFVQALRKAAEPLWAAHTFVPGICRKPRPWKLSRLRNDLSWVREAVDAMRSDTTLCAFDTECYQSELAELENTRKVLKALERALEAPKANTDPAFGPMLMALMLGASQEWIIGEGLAAFDSIQSMTMWRSGSAQNYGEELGEKPHRTVMNGHLMTIIWTGGSGLSNTAKQSSVGILSAGTSSFGI
ncbi:hypothetical protein EDB81DRAFT_895171 [Dactylonectria macrodidyma]|uniref:Uncharacterized protein n=1 Tax=Dactylonectria macrodidyma TaxID=307937 RepID=A0A9P9CXQ7_9HYPO|nr:hypothetical protein EDB81DRAFT_895171 [Dactylonectria macrodidyma]